MPIVFSIIQFVAGVFLGIKGILIITGAEYVTGETVGMLFLILGGLFIIGGFICLSIFWAVTEISDSKRIDSRPFPSYSKPAVTKAAVKMTDKDCRCSNCSEVIKVTDRFCPKCDVPNIYFKEE